MNNTSSTASSLETEMEIIRQKYEKELQSMRKEVEDCKTTIQNLKTSEESLSNTNKDIVSQVLIILTIFAYNSIHIYISGFIRSTPQRKTIEWRSTTPEMHHVSIKLCFYAI